MKRTFTLLFIAAGIAASGQTKLVSQAIVTTKTTIVSPEGGGDEAASPNITSENGEQVRVMRFGGDGESKTTTWIKNDLVKTYSESETSRSTVIRDNGKKMTTTIMEMMGRKTGFYASDEDQVLMRKRMDSLMESRGQNNGFTGLGSPPEFEIAYLNDTKKVAGYECRKALIIATRGNARKDTTVTWYCPDFKLQGVSSTGGSLGGFGGFVSAAANGMEKLNGFPMEYERTMGRGRKMTVQVTKLVTDKEIADKEFDIPKDVEVRAMKDMQNGSGSGFQIRAGGGGNQ